MKNKVSTNLMIAFGVILILAISCKKEEETPKAIKIKFNPTLTYDSVIDIDNNIYKTIAIGQQIWLAENLKTTHYSDGTPISNCTSNSDWPTLTKGGYCWYDNDDKNKDTYGAIYNFYAVEDCLNLCPVGWHVPNYRDMYVLQEFLGGGDIAGGHLKESEFDHWKKPNTGADNKSGFTALPSGSRGLTGEFGVKGYSCGLWTSTSSSPTEAWCAALDRNNSTFFANSGGKKLGLSVRCIKDAAQLITSPITNISYNSATCKGFVYSDGTESLIEKGVCWATRQNPTLLDSVAKSSNILGYFFCVMNNLTPGTKYFVRTYAIFKADTIYGNEINFETLVGSIPNIVTLNGIDITSTTINSGGYISTDGGFKISARGVCWSTTQNPTVDLTTKTNNGTGTGTFVSNITGLTQSTQYYIRSYATNSMGTAYGNEISITTPIPGLPSVNTENATSISFTSAICGGNISNNGGLTITARGVCWSTSQNPTVDLATKTNDGEGSGAFTSSITGLTENTTYYIRAYATNSKGTAYGYEISITTLVRALPSITTVSATNINLTSATSGGNISDDGYLAVTARGVCWSTSINPTVDLSTKTNDGTGIGSFTSSITGLTENTQYYIRAYATNSKGTAYGNSLNFTTLTTSPPSLTTESVTNIRYTSATSGGYIYNDGYLPITARGVCWSTNQNPTVDLPTKTNDGTGTGTFISNITGLTENTTYYIRAYATNSKGTAYGYQYSFKTLAVGVPTLTTKNASYMTQNTLTSGGNITLDGNLAITARGVCWSTSPNPTVELSDKTNDGAGIGTFVSNINGLTANTTYYIRAYATNSYGTGYGNEVIAMTYIGTVTDIDGNVYHTLAIGTQIWMKENLKTTKYNNGASIPNAVNNQDWASQTTGAYCWYNNDINNKEIYGAIYNVYTVLDSRKLCPIGWHIPTITEWNNLATYLGGNDVAGGKMKATTLWLSPNTGADNSSGFSGLPSSMRGYDGTFGTYGESSEYWSTSLISSYLVYYRLYYAWSGLDSRLERDSYGASVRCLKDQ